MPKTKHFIKVITQANIVCDGHDGGDDDSDDYEDDEDDEYGVNEDE